ncbi:pseudouridine synthase [Adhaeribacter pallidiroseus]|uniref:23S rRNA pseudouridine(2604) synthase n=1 Tax=Adhaeribacter pallidiroseus TaxID=2072847 RepID=A0A369QU41_9BACT|nr:pseudouridine synthase [Adhaeribacter pallidiroseus]RDC65688.1 23S rRNA pseudouridine(2604) synthase [Adhaeribacter pallidiroseus]
MEAKRLNKFISDTGFCSRREADTLLEQGRVTVNGKIPEAGTKVTAQDKVRVDGEILRVRHEEPVYLLFNKPAGIATTTDLSVRNNIIQALNYPASLLPIGFLDRDAEGLLFLSNETEWVRKMTKADARYEKEYLVTVDKLINTDFLAKVSEGGFPEPGTERKKNFVTKLGTNRFRIVLEPSTNHHVKKVVEGLGYKVVHLQRTRLADITPGKLQVGMWRTLTHAEVESLKNVVSQKPQRTFGSSKIANDFTDEGLAPRNAVAAKSRATAKPDSPSRSTSSVSKNAISSSRSMGSTGQKRIGKSKPASTKTGAPRNSGRRTGGSPKR